tara:strand:+ start:1492 stop:1656 length:165 start_codon:yes stop_codon:yes gene_type:complete
MDIIFIKEYLTYKIDAVLKNTKKTTAERLISLGVCKEVKAKKKPLKKQLEVQEK